jgi:membrane associated rhomboid family serine protease
VFLGMNSAEGQDTAALAKYGYLPDHEVFEGKLWGLVTSAFVHVEMVHAAFNMYWMWLIGRVFEERFGPLKLLAFVLASAFVSSGIQLISGSMGIGLSGVVYALFGFEWIARKKIPEFESVIDDQVIGVFVIWGLACIPLTYFHIMNVGNLAHFGGLLFGVLLAAILILPGYRIALAGALAMITAVATVPAFWNPFSTDWLAVQAMKALAAENDRAAEGYYRNYP